MAYNYYTAYLNYASTPAQGYKDLLQATIDDQFYNASDVYTIQEELPLGSNTWSSTDVRITHIIQADTGEKLGDDFKNIIFNNLNHLYGLGHLYQFDGFTWVTINTDYYRYVTASAIIRRCNFTLKWYDSNNVLIQEPCVVDYYKFMRLGNVLDKANMSTGDKNRFVLLQNNANTSKITRDYRFIIDGIAYKTVSRDTITKNGLIELTLIEHEVNSGTDDLTNSIAIPTKIEGNQTWG